jgi:alcohol dehydrogenase
MPTHKYEGNLFVWGDGCVADLGGILDDHSADRAMVVCGRNVGNNETVMDAVAGALGDRLIETYTGSRPNTPLETVETGVARKREVNADSLVGVGGGAAIDTAKAICVFDGEGDGEVRDLATHTTPDGEKHVPDLSAPKDPVFSVTTTLSAAEVGNGFGVTDAEAGEKFVVVDEGVRPTACVYDPRLATTTPSSVIGSTGMNALDHSVEVLYSDPRADNPFYRATASRAIGLLLGNLPAAVNDGNLDALEGVLVGAAMSGLGAAGGLGINHSINHALCARHPVSHGDGNSILLPYGVAFNFEAVPERVVDIGTAMGVHTDQPPETVRDAVIERIHDLQSTLGVPSRLRDVDVDRNDFGAMAEVAAYDHNIATNPRKVTVDDIVDILEAAW